MLFRSCWENVPGVLSSSGGRDFGALLGGLGQLGYGWAYRVLDAQYFGVAQRRRRVFVVGYLGDWRRAAAVLFEPASLRGHPAPRRETGEKPAPTLAARTKGGGGLGTDFDCDGGLIARCVTTGEGRRLDGESCTFVAATLTQGTQSKGKGGYAGRRREDDVNLVAHTLRANGFDAGEDGTGRGTPLVAIDMRQASRGEKITNNRAIGSGGPPGVGVGNEGDPAFTVSERGQAIGWGM